LEEEQDNIMAKMNSTNRQTMIYKTLHRRK